MREAGEAQKRSGRGSETDSERLEMARNGLEETPKRSRRGLKTRRNGLGEAPKRPEKKVRNGLGETKRGLKTFRNGRGEAQKRSEEGLKSAQRWLGRIRASLRPFLIVLNPSQTASGRSAGFRP